MEAFVTFALVQTVYTVGTNPEKESLGTIALAVIGFIVGAYILAAGPFFGGSIVAVNYISVGVSFSQ